MEDAAQETANIFKAIHPVEYARKFAEQGVRTDGRGFNDFRKTVLQEGSIDTADGSAMVKIGNTSVVCGIKAELANPPAEEPNCGWLVPNVTISQASSASVPDGPPSSQAQALSVWISDLLNDSVVDRKQLCLCEGRLCWVLYVDIYVLNNDGCLADASTLSLFGALRSLRLPQLTQVSPEDQELPKIISQRKISLKVNKYPFATSFGIWEGKIMVDATSEEEEVCSTSILVAVTPSDKAGNGNVVHALTKPSPACIHHLTADASSTSASVSEIRTCIAKASKRANALQQLVDTFLANKGS
eukprot:m.145076 g.145076  ORF g.145076 m.145076 type:complete len:301 (+) comp14936_c0_seq1:177-1079(+)